MKAIRPAKLQSNRHHQQTNIQLFLQAGCPSCRLANSVKALKERSTSPCSQDGNNNVCSLCSAHSVTKDQLWYDNKPRWGKLLQVNHQHPAGFSSITDPAAEHVLYTASIYVDQSHLHARYICSHMTQQTVLVHWQVVQIPQRINVRLSTSATTTCLITRNLSTLRNGISTNKANFSVS